MACFLAAMGGYVNFAERVALKMRCVSRERGQKAAGTRIMRRNSILGFTCDKAPVQVMYVGPRCDALISPQHIVCIWMAQFVRRITPAAVL